jgi:hypothetical protein|nr:MAG TPA: hypothetical protein [Caudoviricetes sp.]
MMSEKEYKTVDMMQISVPCDEQFSEMMVFAARYAIGRRTYAVSDTVNYIAHVLPYLRRNDIKVIYKDIVEAESENRLGDECDVESWMYLKKRIEDYTVGAVVKE